ncbi:unnamed protein product [Moneuplotes crassus]|uniref:Uncharacterized protein n=1 Tax=Euplotes crassus TaxID=5936 RepID=A0AAD2D6D7_EUPCR|nr:unnamed protein product [Moneuplotes crassus]
MDNRQEGYRPLNQNAENIGRGEPVRDQNNIQRRDPESNEIVDQQQHFRQITSGFEGQYMNPRSAGPPLNRRARVKAALIGISILFIALTILLIVWFTVIK